MSIVAKEASFTRKSSDSVGEYPFYVPKPALSGELTPDYKIRRKNKEGEKYANYGNIRISNNFV